MRERKEGTGSLPGSPPSVVLRGPGRECVRMDACVLTVPCHIRPAVKSAKFGTKYFWIWEYFRVWIFE